MMESLASLRKLTSAVVQSSFLFIYLFPELHRKASEQVAQCLAKISSPIDLSVVHIGLCRGTSLVMVISKSVSGIAIYQRARRALCYVGTLFPPLASFTVGPWCSTALHITMRSRCVLYIYRYQAIRYTHLRLLNSYNSIYLLCILDVLINQPARDDYSNLLVYPSTEPL
jgi:hypothetical protein